jgi:two-component system, sensor histidine kinase and response regulator
MVTDEPLDRTVLEALRRLQSEARPNFPSMIVGLFLDTAPSVLKELETAALGGEVSALRAANHRLLSGSAAVGAVRLSALCHDFELIGRTGVVPDAAERVRAIVAEYERVEAALRTWLTRNSEPGAPTPARK